MRRPAGGARPFEVPQQNRILKLFERIYAPLAAGLLNPTKADAKLPRPKRSQLDRLYQRVVDYLDELVRAVGLKAA